MAAVTACLLVGFWIIFATFGFVVEEAVGYLDPSGVGISAQAILIAEGAAPGFGHLSLFHPPLPFFLTIPFAWAGLPYPAIWMSSFAGAVLATWMCVHLRGIIARRPLLALPLALALVQPEFLHACSSGSPDALLLTLLIPALYFLSRFTLEHKALELERRSSEAPAWVEDHLFSDQRMRFLWSFAFLLAGASLVRPGMVFAGLFVILAAPFLIGSHGWRHPRQSVSFALVLVMPLIAVQLAWIYLFWIYTGNALRGFDAPAVFFSDFAPEPAGKLPGMPLPPGALLLTLLAVAPLAWLSLRLRNVGLALLVVAAPAAEFWTGHHWGHRDGTVADLAVYALFAALILLLLASDLELIPRLEMRLLALALLPASLASAALFLLSPMASGVSWKTALLDSPELLETFRQEREFLTPIRQVSESGPILADELGATPFITLLNTSQPFYLSHQKGFDIAAENPRAAVAAILTPVNLHHPGIRDRAARKWRDLPPSRSYRTSERHRSDEWVLTTWD